MSVKKNKILLMVVCNDGVNDAWEEIGICYIASFLREKNYEVKLMQKREEDIDYECIKDFYPDIIGMTIYERSKKSVFNVAKKLKQLLPNVLISAGGAYPTYAHVELLNEAEFIDYAMRGEGEYTFSELLEKLNKGQSLKGVKGLTYREGNEIIVNENRELIEDINSLPMPARDILVDNKLKGAMIATSRGCLGRCSFCSNQLFWSKWRGRTAQNVVDEIEYLVKEYGITIFNFTDASFEDPDRDCERLRSIAEEIIRRNLKIAYLADFRAEFHRKVNDDLMELLVKSGLSGACIGVETGNESDLKLYRKIATLEDNQKVIDMFNKYGILTLCGIINFNPYTSFEGLRKNIDFMERNRIAANMEKVSNTYKMYKDAALYQKIKEDGLLMEDIFDEVGYKFADERVGRLSDYVVDYVSKINSHNSGAFQKITYYIENFYCFIYNLKIKANLKENDNLRKVFLDFETEVIRLRSKLNKDVCFWFRKLIDLAENNWDTNTANEISEKYLNNDYIINMSKELNLASNKVYIELLRIDRNYAKEFGKI